MTVMLRPQALTGHTRRDYRILIGGQWVDGAEGRTLERLSPAHGVVVSRYVAATKIDAERAIAAARTAFDTGPWPRMTASDRSRLLLNAADMIEARKDDLALLDALESGKPITQAKGELGGAIDIWRYAAALARDLHGESYNTLGDGTMGVVLRDPIGVVSIITPWNFPFLILSQKLPFALAAGCTAVVKPSEMTSASTLVLGEILMEAGLPAGVVNIITGTGPDAGATMTSHPDVDMIAFTGSTLVGKLTMSSAAQTLKKVSLELGGKNPQIVFPDANLEEFTDAAVFGAYFNAGECCNAGSRLIVHEAIADEFLGAVKALAGKARVGDPLDDRTKVGAMISADHMEKVAGYVTAAETDGGNVFAGGARLASNAGQYLDPTIIRNVAEDMAIAREEVFGPVLSVLTVETIE